MSLTVADLHKAIDFYRNLLGYELPFVSEGVTELAASIVGIDGVSADVAQLRLASSGHILELIQWHEVNTSDSHHGPTRHRGEPRGEDYGG
jgi:catechol 2,3-dioxygenase-like lactoylglutathione lyase family enzyme